MKKISKLFETKPPIVYSCIFFCAFILAFSATNNPLRLGNTGTDSSVFNYVARVILNGGMPYRDTFDHKGPLIYLINALGQSINEYLGIWLVELGFIFVTFFLAYKIAKIMGCSNLKALVSVIVCMFSMAFYFEGGNLVEEYACLFIMLQLYIFIQFFNDKKINSIQLIISGISFGAVCLLRINMIPLWIVMCIGVLIKCIKDKKAQTIGKFIFWFFIGILAITIPIIIWLIAGDAFNSFIDDYFTFNFQYSGNNEQGSIIGIIKGIGYFFITPPALLSIIILTIAGFKGRKLLDCLCLGSLILSVLMMSVSKYHFLHYGMILCPLIVYAFSLAMTSEHILHLKIFKYKTRLILGTGIAILIGIIGLVIIDFPFKKVINYFTGMNMDQYFSDSKAVAKIIEDHSEKDSQIIVLDSYDIIYLLSHRMSSSKYSYQLPIIEVDPNKKEAFVSDIEKLNTEIIVTKPDTVVKTYIEDTITDHYTLIDTVGEFEIYKKSK